MRSHPLPPCRLAGLHCQQGGAEVKQIEESLVPLYDHIERHLVGRNVLVSLDALKNQLRGLCRTVKVGRLQGAPPDPDWRAGLWQDLYCAAAATPVAQDLGRARHGHRQGGAEQACQHAVRGADN